MDTSMIVYLEKVQSGLFSFSFYSLSLLGKLSENIFDESTCTYLVFILLNGL